MDSYNTPIVSNKANIQLLKRLGKVIEIRAECVDPFRQHHVDENMPMRDLLVKYHLRNFSIFLDQVGDRWFAFTYCEYAGRDFDTDMESLAAEPEYQQWLESLKSMAVSVNEVSTCGTMEHIFHNP